MQVIELRDAMEFLNDEDEVFGVEYGYRSSSLVSLDNAIVFEDDRTENDWGHEQDSTGQALYILIGSDGGNRYPPSGLRDELEW